jgi:signal transduction histidine kinase
MAALPGRRHPDVADDLEAEEQQRLQEEIVAQAQREAALRDELLSSLAHDLKNPLTSIQGFAALAERSARRGDGIPVERLLANLMQIQRSAALNGIGP